MLDPIDFYHLAGKIREESEDSDSAASRTCINRAYYAAFLVARDASGDTSENSLIHTKIINFYKKKDKKIGNMLGDLFIRRKEADYQLNLNITKRHSGMALKMALEIIETIKPTESVEEEIIENI